MKEILEIVIKSLVENQNEVLINQVDNENGIVFEIKVSESDMGKVIGKQGRVAKSIRTLLRAIASKEHKKVTVEFIDKN